MKVVLTIAGSDSSGGAGIQADLKTFEAFGVFGTSAITVLTAQNTSGVQALFPVEPTFIKQQIQSVLTDFDVAAIKIGMLYDEAIINVVLEMIKPLKIPIVFDPVFISKAGSPLLKDEAVDALKNLFEHVTIITPNQFEAKALFNYNVNSELEPATLPACALLIKHHLINNSSVDKLYVDAMLHLIESPLINTTNLHGSGCSYSSAIAANLALGNSLETSIRIAKTFISFALQTAPNIGHGAGPLNHKEGARQLHALKAN